MSERCRITDSIILRVKIELYVKLLSLKPHELTYNESGILHLLSRDEQIQKTLEEKKLK